jgi:hypothetical protein
MGWNLGEWLATIFLYLFILGIIALVLLAILQLFGIDNELAYTIALVISYLLAAIKTWIILKLFGKKNPFIKYVKYISSNK